MAVRAPRAPGRWLVLRWLLLVFCFPFCFISSGGHLLRSQAQAGVALLSLELVGRGQGIVQRTQRLIDGPTVDRHGLVAEPKVVMAGA
jgi:hypothetical protein